MHKKNLLIIQAKHSPGDIVHDITWLIVYTFLRITYFNLPGLDKDLMKMKGGTFRKLDLTLNGSLLIRPKLF